MLDTSWHERVSKQVRALQIIVGALVTGCVTLLVVFLVMAGSKHAAGKSAETLTWIAVVFAGADLLAWPIMLASITSRGRKAILNGTFADFSRSMKQFDAASQLSEPPNDVDCLMFLFHQRTIIGAAMFEGCAFLACTVYFVEHQPIALGMAILMALGVASHFPTSSRVIGWIEQQMAWLEQERQFAAQ